MTTSIAQEDRNHHRTRITTTSIAQEDRGHY